MKEEQYVVYKHVFPNKKIYIGITKQDPEKRWCNGNHYMNQFVGKAIKKYGWGNILHIIVSDKLTQKQACELEQQLIKKYKSNLTEYGYNKSIGGEIGKKNTYMCDDAINFKNKYKNCCQRVGEDKITEWWDFICKDPLEAQVFNNAYMWVRSISKILKKDGYKIEWFMIFSAINTYLEAWENNWTPESAKYNSTYVLINYSKVIYNKIFNQSEDWKKKDLIMEVGNI